MPVLDFICQAKGADVGLGLHLPGNRKEGLLSLTMLDLSNCRLEGGFCFPIDLVHLLLFDLMTAWFK